MLMRYRSAIGILILSAVSAICAPVPKVAANPSNVPPNRYETIPQVFENTFFRNDRDAFTNRSIWRQINYLIGPFPENEINRDAKNVHNLYVELLEQQVSSDPIIRTPDLANPFNTSLLQLPSVNVKRPVVGTEFIYQEQPPR